MGRFSRHPDERFEEQSRRARPWSGRFADNEGRERGDEGQFDRYSQSYGGERFRDSEDQGYYGRQEGSREGSQSGRQSFEDYSRPYERGGRMGGRWDSRGYGGGRTPTPSSEWGRGFEGYASDESWGSGGGGRHYPSSFDQGSYGGQGPSYGQGSYGQGSYDQGSSYGQGSSFGQGSSGQGFGQSSGQGYGQGSSRFQGEMRRGGGHRGKGPKGYERTDERLREMICERLTDDDSIDASNISVTVANGQVTLEGTVDSRQAKYDAEECAEQCGARDITNNLRIARQGSGMGSGQSSGMGSSLDSGQSGGMSAAGSGSTGGEPASSGSSQRSGSGGSKGSSKGH